MGSDQLLLPCPKCNARGHMDDSHDMDNGYGRWWRSEPTKCDWCAGKGHGAAGDIAAKMVAKLEPELAKLESRVLDTRIELENYRALLGET